MRHTTRRSRASAIFEPKPRLRHNCFLSVGLSCVLSNCRISYKFLVVDLGSQDERRKTEGKSIAGYWIGA